MKRSNFTDSMLSRRTLLKSAAGTAAGAMALAATAETAFAAAKLKGNISHSICQWCFAEHWKAERMCQVAKQLGCKSIELIGPEHWAMLKRYDLKCALVGSHLFVQGINNPKYQPQCIDLMKKSIDNCVEAGFPTVITFTGYAAFTGPWADGGIPKETKIPKSQQHTISHEDGIKNCVAGYKKIVSYAEKKKVSLSLEMLNTREDTHPMKGHPGYQGDHIDYCMEIINKVGSLRLGLLYDIYHVQIMDGDLVRRIGQCKDVINHIHTAGNPGRAELDQKQEIYYPPVMEALLKIGYQGYVGHEFIPTRDPLAGLKQAVEVCDV